MSQNIPSIAQVAKHLETAHHQDSWRGAEALVSYLAEKVEIVHEPRMPEDGFRDGAQLRGMRMREITAFEKALKGFREDVNVAVEGDCLLVTRTIYGQRANGDDVAETVESKFRVADGKIVGMVAVAQSASFSVLRDVLREGGFTG